MDAVAALEREVFTTPWEADTFRSMLERSDGELFVVDDPEAGVVGYAVLWCVLEQGELANIAVTPEHRGRGLGSELMDRVLERARERGVTYLFLEVRESNERAVRMYARRDFMEMGRRPDYYRRPKEDALVLMKTLEDLGS